MTHAFDGFQYDKHYKKIIMGFDDVSQPVLAKKFSASDFNAEDYVKSVLAKYDIYRTIYEQRNNIETLGEETAVSLKKNVYR